MGWLAHAAPPPAETTTGGGAVLAAAVGTADPENLVGCGRGSVGGSGLDVPAMLADYPVAAPFVPHILRWAGTCAVATAPIIAAQLRNESKFNVRAVSPQGAQGPTQFMQATWAAEGIDGGGDGKADPFDIADAVASQVSYDCKMAEQAKKDLAAGRVHGDLTELMLSYYNCGPGVSVASGGVCENAETRNYVRDIPKWARKWSRPDAGSSSSSEFGAKVLAAARRWMGAPYVWGGGTPDGPSTGTGVGGGAGGEGAPPGTVGFDCSGLVLYAVAQASGGRVVLDHQDQLQIHDRRGRPVRTAAELVPGDVIVPAPGHVFIWAGSDTVIEAPQAGDVVKESRWVPPASGLSAVRFG
jgi:cell wall-associated NlpC family hydrolase